MPSCTTFDFYRFRYSAKIIRERWFPSTARAGDSAEKAAYGSTGKLKRDGNRTEIGP